MVSIRPMPEEPPAGEPAEKRSRRGWSLLLALAVSVLLWLVILGLAWMLLGRS
jgi:hypothetical protein